MSRSTPTLAARILATALLIAAAPAQTPVARISVEVPDMQQFVLQATVPVPPGTYLDTFPQYPLAVLVGGQPVTTQVETVARYPRAADGAAVVELLARVTRPAGAAPGTEVTFDVVRHDHPRATTQPAAEAAALLAQPRALRLATRDLHGNRYSADLYAKARSGHPSVKVLRNGAYVREVRTHEVLALDATGTGPALPHMMGVHATFRTTSAEEFILLDLHVHNGMDGLDTSTPLDDTLADLYFDQLELELPQGWQCLPAYQAPYMGPGASIGGGRVMYPLVKALPDGALHLLPQQAQFTRRYVLGRSLDSLVRGRDVLARRTFGFAVPGFVGPRELWSWWSPDTPNYLPQRHVLPQLDFLDREQLRVTFQARRDTHILQLMSGAPSAPSNYPFRLGTIGWAHPWGYDYGGVAGGQEIEQWPGVDVAWARCQAGLQAMEIQAQCYDDRQPVALYALDGHPTRFESIVNQQGTYGPWMATYFHLTPSKSSTLFGFPTADRAQAIGAYEGYRVPPYEKELRAYEPIDLQHLTRYLTPWLTLAWLTNDAEAKRAIEQHAELFRITFSEVYNSNYGHVQGVGLLHRLQMAAAYPGRGGSFGRGEAWGLQATLAWYALGDTALRDRYRPWYGIITGVLRASVSTCTGNLTSVPIWKSFKGVYQTRQSFEASYFLHAVQGLRRSVFEGVSPSHHADLTHVLIAGAEASTRPPFWNPSQRAQHRHVATRLFPESSTDFCFNIPSNGFTEFFDPWTAMTTWAYAYAHNQDPVYLQRCAEVLNNSNALGGHQAEGLTNIADRAPMLALLQILAR